MMEPKPMDHTKLADQLEALAASMEGISEPGREFLLGAETVLRVIAKMSE